ncbi:MAG TPA: Na+/H+ antiporter [Gemmatimonadaceae bacterium]|nr:Na+/H+ antiporter [Gemmatimonadaceae bacterium]
MELLILLIAVAGGLRILAQRWGVPHPVLLVLGGLGVALIPGLPQANVDPELLFVIFVPPLLYWSALTISLREMRTFFGPIVRLATGLVIVTMCAVAAIVHFLAPMVGWPEAFVLGAIVSPPDPVAATAVLRPLGAPRDVTTILEGEGLINDATALVAYRLAVAAVVAGSFSFWHAAGSFAFTGLGGVLVGAIVAHLIVWVRTHIPHVVVVENALSLLSPFIAYLPADALHVSGVLAVVTMGLILGAKGPRVVAPATRLQAGAMWSMVTFLLESLIFMLVGLELPRVIVALRSHTLTQLAEVVLATTAVCILVRFVWVFISIYLGDSDKSRKGARKTSKTNRWKKPFFIAWAGLRGADSLVIAIALPLTIHGGAPFPSRDLIIFVTFGVIFCTLVLQGFSLAPLVKKLGLEGEDAEAKEERLVRVAMANAALQSLRAIAKSEEVPSRVVEKLRDEYEHRRSAAKLTHVTQSKQGFDAAAYRALRRRLQGAERAELLKLADEGKIGGDVMRHVQRQQDLRDLLLTYDEEAGADTHEHLAAGDDFTAESEEDESERPG